MPAHRACYGRAVHLPEARRAVAVAGRPPRLAAGGHGSACKARPTSGQRPSGRRLGPVQQDHG
eukprot:9260530-Lingulodinium_polyedra.AAC.1